MIIKLINHAEVTEKVIGQELHVTWGRTLCIIHVCGCELLLLLLHGSLWYEIIWQSHWLYWRLELTVCREQIVVLSLKRQRKIRWCWMCPQCTDWFLHLVAVRIDIIIGTGQSRPRHTANVLWPQQLRLWLLIVTDWRRQWSFKISINLGDRRWCSWWNIPNGTEWLLVCIWLDRRAAPERVQVIVLRWGRDRWGCGRVPEGIFSVTTAHTTVGGLHGWCRVWAIGQVPQRLIAPNGASLAAATHHVRLTVGQRHVTGLVTSDFWRGQCRGLWWVQRGLMSWPLLELLEGFVGVAVV